MSPSMMRIPFFCAFLLLLFPALGFSSSCDSVVRNDRTGVLLLYKTLQFYADHNIHARPSDEPLAMARTPVWHYDQGFLARKALREFFLSPTNAFIRTEPEVEFALKVLSFYADQTNYYDYSIFPNGLQGGEVWFDGGSTARAGFQRLVSAPLFLPKFEGTEKLKFSSAHARHGLVLSDSIDRLENLWQGAWKNKKTGVDPMPLFHTILTAYSEFHRSYHTLGHLVDCLSHAETLEKAKNPSDILLAIFFHDIVYNPRRGDNEEKSAEQFLAGAQILGVSQEQQQRVAKLILATKTHQAYDSDSKILLDIDLSILGAEPAEFDLYDEQIRDEYHWVPIDEYKKARAKVLRSFLERKQIYRTRLFRDRFELKARQNIRRILLKY